MVQNTVIPVVRRQFPDVIVIGGKVDEVIVLAVAIGESAGDTDIEIADRVNAIAGRIGEGVVAITACQRVVANTTVDRIVAITAQQRVACNPAIYGVVT